MKKNKSKLIIGIVLVLIGLGLLIWTITANKANAPSNETEDDQVATTTETAEVENDAEELADPGVITIKFTNDGFEPSNFAVTKGTVVTVKNESSTQVQFSSADHPTHLENTGMNLRALAPGESASFTADKVGEWGFHDHFNANHEGVMSVTE